MEHVRAVAPSPIVPYARIASIASTIIKILYAVRAKQLLLKLNARPALTIPSSLHRVRFALTVPIRRHVPPAPDSISAIYHSASLAPAPIRPQLANFVKVINSLALNV
jgi:hypothetical protein